jgi:Zn ribbon nucleic-acid-binding protein
MQGCQHERTEFLYRRDGIEYVRCVDCGQVFEAEDLDSVAVYEEDEKAKPKKRR